MKWGLKWGRFWGIFDPNRNKPLSNYTDDRLKEVPDDSIQTQTYQTNLRLKEVKEGVN